MNIFKRKKRECGKCKHREKHGWCKPEDRHVPAKAHEFLKNPAENCSHYKRGKYGR